MRPEKMNRRLRRKRKRGRKKKHKEIEEEREIEIERQRERKETHWHSQLDRRRVKQCDELPLRFIFAKIYILFRHGYLRNSVTFAAPPRVN